MAVSWVAVTAGGVTAIGSLLFSVQHQLGWQSLAVDVTGLVFLSTALVGAALLRSDGHNKVGWIFLISGVSVPISNLGADLAEAAYHHGYHLPGRAAIGLVAMAAAVLGVFLIATLGVLWFPEGDLGGRKRRALALVCGLELAGLMYWVLFSTPFAGDDTVANPIAPHGWPGALANVLTVTILLAAPLTTLTTMALFCV